MKTLIYYTFLIELIRKVHFKISIIILHMRVKNYRKSRPKNKDISEDLQDYIDEIIENNKHRQSQVTHSVTVVYTNMNHRPKHLAHIDHQEVGDLSRYFKQINNESANHNRIEEKLQKSTIDHMHAAVRFARDNDKRNAIMHADIACSSCKELAHFMEKERHKEFITQLKFNIHNL